MILWSRDIYENENTKIPIVPTLKPYYIKSITAGKFYRSSLMDSHNINYDKV